MSLGVTNRFERVARKTHSCEECEQPIIPGQAYFEFRSAFTDDDGKFGHFSNKIHRICQEKLDKEEEEYQREMEQVIDWSNEHMWEHKYP